MKVLVIVIMALYSAITSAKEFPENLYERYHSKCIDVKKLYRHPSQLAVNNKCYSTESKHMFFTTCGNRQFFQYKNSNCKSR